MLAVCGALGAVLLNQSAVSRCEQVDELIRFLKYIKNQIECFGLPSREILKSCEEGLLDNCGFTNCSKDGGFDMLAIDCDINDRESSRIVCDFLNGFGKCYRDEQIKECEDVISALSERRTKLYSELEKKKKVNNTLCIASAICFGLMLA